MLITIIILQIICILLVSTGIMFEYMYEAHLGFVLITVGSLVFAIVTKLENYLIKHRKENNHETGIMDNH
jgi:hypothetical protein